MSRKKGPHAARKHSSAVPPTIKAAGSPQTAATSTKSAAKTVLTSQTEQGAAKTALAAKSQTGQGAAKTAGAAKSPAEQGTAKTASAAKSPAEQGTAKTTLAAKSPAEQGTAKTALAAKSPFSAWIAGMLGLMAGVAIMVAVGLATGFGAGNPVEVMQPVSDAQKQPESEKSESKRSFTTDDIMKAAEQSVVSTEFMQRFFDDKIIYKEGSELQYSPIDKSLPMNNYDWTKLTHEDGRLAYADNGKKAVFGIDVSEYQYAIDWEKVAADGVGFAILRLGYRGYGESGVLKLDQYFESNIKGATDAGIEIGVYFFSQALDAKEAVEEAEFVLENISGYELTYPVILDIEDVPEDARTSGMTKAELTDAVAAFCEAVEAAGHRPMIYANTRWFVSKVDMSKLVKYDKWLAQYYDLPFFPYQFQMWQYTDQGSIDGIAGTVDMNLCFSE